MPELFTFNVDYKNEELELEGEFRQWGYNYQLIVFIGENELVFEPDEEHNLRAVIRESTNHSSPLSTALVKLVGEKLEEIFR
jgi:hypothetical protein